MVVEEELTGRNLDFWHQIFLFGESFSNLFRLNLSLSGFFSHSRFSTLTTVLLD